jgi:hypothetical protein
MSGAEPLRDDRHEAEPGTLEPSMEEILASIRRILADGQGLWGGSQDSSADSDETEPLLRSDRLEASKGVRRSNGRAEPPQPRTVGARGAPLVSAATEASVAAAFQALVSSQFVRSTDLVADLTREMIRPLLEAWIDEHLPGIVERLVAAEIARIRRGE